MRLHRFLAGHRLAGAITTFGVLGALAISGLASIERVELLMREGGSVESASASLHFVAAAALAWLALRRGRVFLLLMVYALLMGLRELDGQKAFTSQSVTKLSFYIDAGVPWFERALVMGLIVLLLVATARLIWRYGRAFHMRLKCRDGAAWSLATGLVMLPALKILDAFPRWLRDWTGVAVEGRALALVSSMEEIMELVLPLVFLAAVLQFHWRSRAEEDSRATAQGRGRDRFSPEPIALVQPLFAEDRSSASGAADAEHARESAPTYSVPPGMR